MAGIHIDGYNRIKEWEHKLREVLDDILKAVEDKKSLGYFDSLIDIETHANLIILARNRYIDIHNILGGYNSNPKLHVTKEDIQKQSKGGYSTKEIQHIIDLLVVNK